MVLRTSDVAVVGQFLAIPRRQSTFDVVGVEKCELHNKLAAILGPPVDRAAVPRATSATTTDEHSCCLPLVGFHSLDLNETESHSSAGASALLRLEIKMKIKKIVIVRKLNCLFIVMVCNLPHFSPPAGLGLKFFRLARRIFACLCLVLRGSQRPRRWRRRAIWQIAFCVPGSVRGNSTRDSRLVGNQHEEAEPRERQNLLLLLLRSWPIVPPVPSEQFSVDSFARARPSSFGRRDLVWTQIGNSSKGTNERRVGISLSIFEKT